MTTEVRATTYGRDGHSSGQQTSRGEVAYPLTSPPPGPRGNILFGHTLSLRRAPLQFLQVASTYGDLVSLRIGFRPVCLVNHPDHIYEILVSQRSSFRKNNSYIRQTLGRLLGDGMVTSDGEDSVRPRRIVQPAFHHQRLADYGRVMVEQTQSMVDSWQPDQILDVLPAMRKLTLQVIVETLFHTNLADPSIENLANAMEFLQQAGRKRILSLLPLPAWVPTYDNRRLRKAIDVPRTIVTQMIDERLASGRVGDDLLGMLLSTNIKDDIQLTREETIYEAITLLISGHETTANALTWTLYLLAKHPRVADRLRIELDKVLAGRLPTPDDLKQLPYLEMVLNEALRLYPPGAVMARVARNDTILGDHHIKKDTVLLISAYVTQRDSRFFEQPEHFMPERFADDYNRYAFIPFGAGPRKCLGDAFALTEARLVLGSVDI